MNSNILKITHDYGFFSCSSVALHHIVDYFNRNMTLPHIDRFNQYTIYKDDPTKDLTELIYESFPIDIEYTKFVNFFWEMQFEKYKELDYMTLTPFIKKYFNPSKIILNKVCEIEKRFSIDYNNTIALCYRGNDKCKETDIGSIDTYISNISYLYNRLDSAVIFVQTDEQEFLEEVMKRYPNVLYLPEIPLIKHNPTIAVHHTIEDKKIDFACNFLASVIVMSKCRYLITHSGNVGMWISLYRGNFDNSSQYLRGVWV